MKILQVIPNLSSGGAERFVCELSNELVENKLNCSILNFYNNQDQTNYYKTLSSSISHFVIQKKNGFDPSLFFKLYAFIRNAKYDVVHLHVGAIKYVLIAAILCRKIRFVATIHNDAYKECEGFLGKLIRLFLFKFQFVIPVTISEESNRSFKSLYRLSAPVIYNGVSSYSNNDEMFLDDSLFNCKATFVCVASVQPSKNQLVLIDVFNKLIAEGYNIKLLLVGSWGLDIPYNQQVEKKIQSSNNVIYLGLIAEPRTLLSKSSAMILSSLYEGMPMSILESFSVSCPVISTPVGGCKNVIQDSINGILAAGVTENDIYNAIKRFLTLSDKDLENLSNNAYETYTNYSIEKCASKYISIYNKK